MTLKNLFKKNRKKYLILLLAISLIVIGTFLSANNLKVSKTNLENVNTSDFSFIGEIAQEVSPSVVSVQSISTNQEEEDGQLFVDSGSGLIVDQEGYMVTNYHVISNADEIIIVLSDGRQTAAKMIGAYDSSDLALLKIDLKELTEAKLGNSDQVEVGDLAFAIGNPGGEQFARSLTMGVISGIERELLLGDGNNYRLIQTDAAINPGNSGGPLVNSLGEVIGINSVKIVDEDFEGMGFAIPINTVRQVIEDISPDVF